MIDDAGRKSVEEAREKADRLVALVEGWVNAEEAQREYRVRAEARVADLEAAARIDGAQIDDLTAEIVRLTSGDAEGDRGVLLAKLYGARSAAAILSARVTALEAALRDMCNTAESHAAGKSDREQVRHVVDQCRVLLAGREDL